MAASPPVPDRERADLQRVHSRSYLGKNRPWGITSHAASRAGLAPLSPDLPARDALDTAHAGRIVPPRSCRARSPANRASPAPAAAPATAIPAPAAPRLSQSTDECLIRTIPA